MQGAPAREAEVSQVRGPGMLGGGSDTSGGTRVGSEKGNTAPQPLCGAGSPGLSKVPRQSENGRPRRDGSHLPVQGLHAGLPGAGGRAPRNPGGPPAARQPGARAPGSLAAGRRRRRRRWPVHGARRCRGENCSGKGSGAWRVPPRASCALICCPPAQTAAAISCHLAAPRYPQGRARAVGVGEVRGVWWGRGAGGSGWRPVPPRAQGHLGTRPSSRYWGQKPSGLSNLDTGPKLLGVEIYKRMMRNMFCSGNYQNDWRYRVKESLGKSKNYK